MFNESVRNLVARAQVQCGTSERCWVVLLPKGREINKPCFLLGAFWPLASLKSLANTTALSTFFASPAVKIHQIKKHVLFNSRPSGTSTGTEIRELDKVYVAASGIIPAFGFL